MNKFKCVKVGEVFPVCSCPSGEEIPVLDPVYQIKRCQRCKGALGNKKK